MLKRLQVSNLAIVEKATVDFCSGLTVITGETGAGKSVLMGALDMVLGGRAEASSVRDGASEAEVEAEFDGFTLRRTLTREGRSRAWRGEESISLSELKELAHSLVDIHGPRANQRLLEENFQRESLDGFGGISTAAYHETYEKLMKLKAEKAELEKGGTEEEIDFLRYQVNELENANLTEDDETIIERHATAAHAEEIAGNANELTEGLSGDHGAAEILSRLHPRFAATARHLPEAKEWAAEAEEIVIRLQELSREIVSTVSRIDLGSENLQALDERLTVINRLTRKYRVPDVKALMTLLDEKRERLDGFEGRDIKLAQLNKEIAAAEKATAEAGAVLTKARTSAAKKLAKAITEELHGLGFLQAKFDVRVEAIEPTAHGLDRIVYLFEPNPGEAARALASIASSGEIARVMLAMKVVLTESANDQSCQTLVFDEIDANIGGEVGKIVGEKMRAVAKNRQVIAITHLPQSAVYGEKHLVVAKAVEGGRTRTGVHEVSGEARVKEIARMLGGEELTSVVKKHAKELLEISH